MPQKIPHSGQMPLKSEKNLAFRISRTLYGAEPDTLRRGAGGAAGFVQHANHVFTHDRCG